MNFCPRHHSSTCCLLHAVQLCIINQKLKIRIKVNKPQRWLHGGGGGGGPAITEPWRHWQLKAHYKATSHDEAQSALKSESNAFMERAVGLIVLQSTPFIPPPTHTSLSTLNTTLNLNCLLLVTHSLVTLVTPMLPPPPSLSLCRPSSSQAD